MKNNFKFLITFCLMLFITFFKSSSAYAVDNPFSTGSEFNVSGNYTTLNYNYVRGDIPQYTYSASLFSSAGSILTSFRILDEYYDEKNRVINVHAMFSDGKDVVRTIRTYPVGGDSTYSFTVTNIPNTNYTKVIVNGNVTQDNVLNFNWQGDGLYIYNLKTGMNVSGYVEDTIKYFDIECYGKFIYKGSDTFFTSFAYKKMQTSIQLASCLAFGSESRKMGEGLGVKSFEWISNDDQLNNGDEIRFRIVYKAPLISKGTYSIKVGTTVNNGVSDNYISNTVTGVNFLNSNWVYNEPLDTSGETGNVGSTPGNSTWDQSNSSNPNTSGQAWYEIIGDVGKSVVNFFKTIVSVMTDVGTIAPQIATLFSSMFSFLPSPIPQLVTTSFVLIIFIAVLKFLRG